MKKAVTLLLILVSVHVYAQYCGTSGVSQCTPTGTLTQPGFYPESQQLPPFVNTQPSTKYLQYLNFSVISFMGNTIPVDSITIDSIVGLPNGLCWSTNNTSNRFSGGEHSCIRITGTPLDSTGQYKLRFYCTLDYNGPSDLSFFGENIGLKYYVRLKNNGDIDVPVDTSRTENFVPYGGGCSCALDTPLAITATLISNDTICDGSNVTVNIQANRQFTSGTSFVLSHAPPGSPFVVFNPVSDTISPNNWGMVTFHIPSDFVDIGGTPGPISLQVFSFNPDAYTVVTDDFYILDGAYLAPLPDTVHGCSNTSIVLDAGYRSNQEYLWLDMNTGNVLGFSDVLSLNPPTNRQVLVVTETPVSGCFSSDTVYVQVTPAPNINYEDSSFNLCAGDSATFRVHGSYYYFWQENGIYRSSDSVFTVTPSVNTTYTLVAQEPDYGCQTVKDFTVTIKEAPYQGICMVTVDSASAHNIVVWEKVDKGATDSFYVYREITTNVYEKIAAIDGDSLSEFHDYSANPNLTGYRYRISVVDTCGNLSTTSAFHNTIHLQYLGSGNLQWNGYGVEFSGTPITSYDIYVDEQGSGVWQLLVSVPGSQETATDPNYATHPDAIYRVVANWPFTCTSSRSTYHPILSNVISQQVSGTKELSHSNLRIYMNSPGTLQIDAGSLHVEETVMYDINGREVVRNTGGRTIAISPLTNGVYVVAVKTNLGIVFKRWMKL